MKATDMYKVTLQVLRKQLKETPDKIFTGPSGEKVSLKDVYSYLKQISAWVYPELSTDDVSRVTRCKKCKHYKKYRKKGSANRATFMACELDKQLKDPLFFCGRGEEED